MDIPYFNADQVKSALTYRQLIAELKKAFSKNKITVPARHHHQIAQNTLLLMPAWQLEKSLGIKMVTVFPKNSSLQKPTIQGIYVLMDGLSGEPRLLLDAKSLTNIRTAATSALAADFLAVSDPGVFLMVGTGNLAPDLVRAHGTVRNYSKMLIWGRDYQKAVNISEQMAHECMLTPVKSLEAGVKQAAVISVATTSQKPLINGGWIQAGQHYDLVGSYRPEMREADDHFIQKVRLFIDSETAIAETGDLKIPLETGIIEHAQIHGTLFDLCGHKIDGRKSSSEVTCFKSVGHGLEDLVAAEVVANKNTI
jgi:ornithine cyclodeaminase